MISKRKWLKDSVVLARQLIVQQWLPLGVLFLVSALLILTAEDLSSAGTQPSQETQRWVMQLLLGLWDLVEGVLTILILSWGIPMVRELNAATLLKKPFQASYLGSFMAEYLRVLAQVLMWGILLLVPGFVRYCQLSFVPLIAIFSKNYREGEVDAVQLSRELIVGRFWRVLFAIAGTMALETGFEFIPELLPELHNYFVRILCLAATYFFSILTYSLIFVLFEEAMETYQPKPAEES